MTTDPRSVWDEWGRRVARQRPVAGVPVKSTARPERPPLGLPTMNPIPPDNTVWRVLLDGGYPVYRPTPPPTRRRTR